VLCLGTVALWLRSLFVFDDLVHVSPGGPTNIVSMRGRMFFQIPWVTKPWKSHGPYAAGGWFLDSFSIEGVGYPTAGESRGWSLLGFDYFRSDRKDGTAGERVLILPHWFICLVTSFLPARWALTRYRRIRAAHRQERGLCIRCGYDLRSSAERCPECGTPITTEGAG